ncbi:glycosyltransferase family 2 protein [Patescibacteria group bacterium]|nr:glycosyltransferase family 2 protein [Patescibacteria group bacterium]
MEQELISVVMPVYNEEDLVTRALESLQNQTWKNLEIIVVDDHSTDNTAAIVKKIAAQDSRVHYYLNPKGVSKRKNWRGYDINAGWSARAYGFSIAKAQWVTTQDSDDASLLNRIEVQYMLAKKYNATFVAVGWMDLNEQTLGKKLDVERIFNDVGEEHVIITPKEISAIAKKEKGVLMVEPFHQFIPFPFKWFPYTRKLFYRSSDGPPGADNCMFFSREVIDRGINFRTRNKRTWGTPSGRGSGRDFFFRTAYELGNSWSFRLPLYLWNVKLKNKDYVGYDKYLV